MGNIVLLDDLTINKIAAGEVIERPASVVKELVENSIDAGATNINVEIKNGGISYIRVTDNGKGIMPDDMEIAFERHATSKIRVAEDLETVKSMGFRGEALASIAAISKVSMKSKTMDNDIGYEIIVEGGDVLQKEEAGCPNGTTITIENLFYNTPVRYKFLKKDFTEAGYIEDVMTRIALIHPEIAIKFISSGKTIIQTAGNGQLKDVVYHIYGKEIAENILDVSYEYEDVKVTGVIGRPSISRSNRANQIFFVNKRYVKDKTLSSSAEQGFKGMITIGKFGFLILNIEMNPQKVDVNVHPAKLEVRFEEESKVFKAVYHAIKDTLLKNDLVANQEKEHYIEENQETSEILGKQEQKSLFQKIIARKEEKKETQEEPNIVEQLYETRKLNIPTKEDYASNFNEIMGKMAEMKKTIDDYKVSTGITEILPKKEVKNTESIDDSKQIQNEGISNIEAEEIQYETKVEFKEEQDTSKNELEKTQYTNINELEEAQKINKTELLEGQEINKNELVGEQGTSRTELAKETQDTSKIELPEDYSQTIQMQTPFDEMQETKVITEEMKQEISQAMENEETQVMNIKQIIEQEQNQEEIENSQSLEQGKTEEQFDEMYTSVFGSAPIKETIVKEEPEEYKVPEPEYATGENLSVFEGQEEYKIPAYKFIGIAFSTYILIELGKELYIIDQHAAHERIMYEKVKENYYREDGKDSQLMLLPDIITLTHKEMDIAKENMKMFEKAGFILEEFGENTIKLTGVPNICLELDTKELFLETLDEINTVARTAKQEIEEKFIATIACKAAVKANMALTKEEVESLMDKLLTLPNPFTCPHGRPTAIKMTKADIEKKFSRR